MVQAFERDRIKHEMSVASWPGAIVRLDNQTDSEAPITLMLKTDGFTPAHVETAGWASIGTLLKPPGSRGREGFKIWFVWTEGTTPTGDPGLIFIQRPGQTVIIPASWFHAVFSVRKNVLIGTPLRKSTDFVKYGNQITFLVRQLSADELRQDLTYLMDQGTINSRSLVSKTDLAKAFKTVRKRTIIETGVPSTRLDSKGRTRKGKNKRLTKKRKTVT
jgi:hypothetical protein